MLHQDNVFVCLYHTLLVLILRFLVTVLLLWGPTVLQVGTWILHLCSWIPSNVITLLPGIGAHPFGLAAGEELQLAKYLDFLHCSQKRATGILKLYFPYFHFDTLSYSDHFHMARLILCSLRFKTLQVTSDRNFLSQ